MASPAFDEMKRSDQIESSHLFAHQEAVFQNLLSTAQVFFSGRWRRLSLTPRFARLLIGSTGSGKSHLVRHLAQMLRLPLFEIQATNWMPLGASNRGGPPTWPQIIQFCVQYRKGIIFLDELDKLGGWTDWQNFIRVEVFSLLDRRVPDGLEFPRKDDYETISLATSERLHRLSRLRLDRAMLVVGAGAFQNLWQAKETPAIGFQRGPRSGDLEFKDLAGVVPREIINRFSSPVLSLDTLDIADYRAILAVFVRRLPFDLRCIVQRCGESTIRDAASNRLGCRWLEELLLHALIEENAVTRVAAGVHPEPLCPQLS